jgi:prophage regulatory protein
MPHPSPLPLPSATDLVPVFLRLPSVIRVTGLGRSTIYRLMAEQKFPCPVRLGPRAVAWRRSEIEAWSDARPLASN